ncbi:MAG: UvrD-helicase domain-containing protein [Candidatus Nanopelagicales bacterium]
MTAPVSAPGPRSPGSAPGSNGPDVRPEDLRDLVGIPLTDEQVAAATAPLAPGVVVAGAGSGKTTVMAARVVWLVASGQLRPDQVLGLTFTNKAAAALLAGVRSSLRRAGVELGDGLDPDEPGEPVVSTYHAFASRLLAEHGLRIGVEPGARLLADAARYQVAYRAVCRTRHPVAALDTGPAFVVADVLALDDALAEHAVEPADLRAHDERLLAEVAALPAPQKAALELARTSRRRIDLSVLVEEFRALKADGDLVDFADQVRLSRQLAETRPEVGAMLREDFRVVLLDEYQDTSTAQRRLLQALFGAGHPVTAVGDPCQAIYGWRGASVFNIDAFPDHFPIVEPEGDVRPAPRYPLSQNRRSGPRILDLANDVSAPLREVHPGVRPLTPGATGKGGGALRCALLDTFTDEVAWVADRVAEAGRARGSWRDVAVLCRASVDFPALQEALEQRGVPVEVSGVAGLLERPEVVDLRSVLEVLHDPTANAALLRLLTGPRWAIGARDLAVLGQRAADLAGGRRRRDPDEPRPSLGEALEDAVAGVDPAEIVSLSDALEDLGSPATWHYSPQARERLTALAAELRSLRAVVGEPLADLVHRVLAVTGLDVEIAASPAAVARRRRTTLAAFVDLASAFRGVEGEATLGAFLAWLRDAERYDAMPEVAVGSPRDAVALMTVHKAKGLEFPVVVLPFLSETVFPSAKSAPRWPTSPVTVPLRIRDEAVPPDLAGYPGPEGPTAKALTAFKQASREQELLDETRLAYVALTRAESLLVASGSWWGPHQSTRRGPSAYLSAVRDACEAGAGTVDHWADPPPDGAVNPAREAATREVAWPAPVDLEARARLRAVADAVRAAVPAVPDADPTDPGGTDPGGTDPGGTDPGGTDPGGTDLGGTDPGGTDPGGTDPDGSALGPGDRDLVAAWDRDLRLLLAERHRAEAAERVVALPDSLSATQLMALHDDPDSFARALVRPMPRPPSPSARRGTRFHAWVESRFGQQPLLDPDDLPGAADSGIDSDADLDAMREAFLGTDYAARTPVAVEAPFALVLGGRVVRGRIDAVFGEEVLFDDLARWEVVDWKTGRDGKADPLQLALYRLAWAELQGVDPERVDAAFLYVRTGRVVRPGSLPGRAELEAILSGAGPGSGGRGRGSGAAGQ